MGTLQSSQLLLMYACLFIFYGPEELSFCRLEKMHIAISVLELAFCVHIKQAGQGCNAFHFSGIRYI